jgi:hypothetical protein
MLSQMSACATVECVTMDAPLALVRLKTRVDPEIPLAVKDLLRRSSITVRVKARIDEKGDVTVSETQGTNSYLNDSVRSAVQRWKFLPAIVRSETRCVDTEIAIVVSSDAPTSTQR